MQLGFFKNQKNIFTTKSPKRFKATTTFICSQSSKITRSMIEIPPILPKTITRVLQFFSLEQLFFFFTTAIYCSTCLNRSAAPET